MGTVCGKAYLPLEYTYLMVLTRVDNNTLLHSEWGLCVVKPVGPVSILT